MRKGVVVKGVMEARNGMRYKTETLRKKLR